MDAITIIGYLIFIYALLLSIYLIYVVFKEKKSWQRFLGVFCGLCLLAGSIIGIIMWSS